MKQREKRNFLIRYLLQEETKYKNIEIPKSDSEQKRLLRSLMNVRLPHNIGNEFLDIQDEYLKTEIKVKGITDIDNLTQIKNGIYLWQGDITTLKCDAITVEFVITTNGL